MKNFILFLILILPFTASCQLLDSLSLDTTLGCASIQEAVKDSSNTIKLVLSKNKLSKFPDEIRKLTNLQYLDLSKNKITEIPPWIGELKDLQFLILSKNKIDSLPPQLGDLENLKYLIINRSDLSYLPHTIGKLKQLRYIDFWGDNLSQFPPELKDLSSTLLVLDLRDVAVNTSTQAYLKTLLPNTTIYFSPVCPCER